jgi:hypothetical protein
MMNFISGRMRGDKSFLVFAAVAPARVISSHFLTCGWNKEAEQADEKGIVIMSVLIARALKFYAETHISGLARCVCTYKAPNRIPARILMLRREREKSDRGILGWCSRPRTFQLDCLAPAYSQMAKFVTGLLNFWRERCWWNMHALPS